VIQVISVHSIVNSTNVHIALRSPLHLPYDSCSASDARSAPDVPHYSDASESSRSRAAGGASAGPRCHGAAGPRLRCSPDAGLKGPAGGVSLSHTLCARAWIRRQRPRALSEPIESESGDLIIDYQ
jgi:hypothetical protein